MRPAQHDARRDRRIELQFGQHAIRLLSQQTQQLGLHRRGYPADASPASLLHALGLATAKTLCADLLRIVVADRKTLSQNPHGVWWVCYQSEGKLHREKVGRKSDAICTTLARQTSVPVSNGRPTCGPSRPRLQKSPPPDLSGRSNTSAIGRMTTCASRGSSRHSASG